MSAFDARFDFQDVDGLIDTYFENKVEAGCLVARPSGSCEKKKKKKKAYKEHYQSLPFSTAEEWMDHLLGTWESWDCSTLGFILWESIQAWKRVPLAPSTLTALEEILLIHWILPHDPHLVTERGTAAHQG